MESPDGSVILHDPKRNTLYFAAVTGKNSGVLLRDLGQFSEAQVPIQGSIAGKACSTGRSILINTIGIDLDHYKGIDEKIQKPSKTMVCTPLRSSDGILGVTQILNKCTGIYSDRDPVLLEQFASQAGIAIRNARIFEDLAAHMGRYVSSEQRTNTTDLIREINRPLHEETLSVMFADLRGPTTLTQTFREITKMGQVLREFLQLLTEEILRRSRIGCCGESLENAAASARGLDAEWIFLSISTQS